MRKRSLKTSQKSIIIATVKFCKIKTIFNQMLKKISFLVITIVLFLSSFLVYSPSAMALGGVQPILNEQAPSFRLSSNQGSTISLSDYQGKWLVVYFYPQDFTPGCTLEAQRFQRDYAQYQARNTEIIGISVDDVQSHEDFCDSEGLKFPLLADTDGSISKAYGSWLSGRSLRHTYIINPDGVLVANFLGVRPAIHSTEVLDTLDKLQL